MKERIIYEDKEILVCYKPANMPTQTDKIGEKDLVSELKNYLSKASIASGKAKNDYYLALIHRLDQPVEGVLVFAKTPNAAALLSKQVQNNTMEKYYLALTRGVMNPKEDTLVHWLSKDAKTNSSRVVSKEIKNAKRAELTYKTLMTDGENDNNTISLIEVALKTGRHHQIRVQMASTGHPLLGDRKYFPGQITMEDKIQSIQTVALCAYKIVFIHPATNQKVVFSRLPEGEHFAPYITNAIL